MMRNAVLGIGAALIASFALSACGSEPDPIAPVEPSFDQTLESIDTDGEYRVLPGDGIPVIEPELPAGPAPVKRPEILEDDPATLGDTASEILGEASGEPESPL